MKYIITVSGQYHNEVTFELKDEEFDAWLDMWKADKTMGSEFHVVRRHR